MVFTNVDDAFLRANATVPRNVGLSNVGTGASYGCRKQKKSRVSQLHSFIFWAHGYGVGRMASQVYLSASREATIVYAEGASFHTYMCIYVYIYIYIHVYKPLMHAESLSRTDTVSPQCLKI